MITCKQCDKDITDFYQEQIKPTEDYKYYCIDCFDHDKEIVQENKPCAVLVNESKVYVFPVMSPIMTYVMNIVK